DRQAVFAPDQMVAGVELRAARAEALPAINAAPERARLGRDPAKPRRIRNPEKRAAPTGWLAERQRAIRKRDAALGGLARIVGGLRWRFVTRTTAERRS